MINPVWLRTFCTLVELGHFTRTAEQLHMTQSGVSQQVRKLEQQLDVSLLIREGKQFTLSEAGRRLYDRAQSILDALATLEQSVRKDAPYEGLVRVISPGSVGLKLYPQLLALQQRHPNLTVDHRFAPNADVEAAVAESRADIGFTTAKPVLSELSAEAIAEEALLLVAPSSMPTSRKQGMPDWDALKSLGFIDHPDGRHHADLLLSANYPQFEHIGDFEARGFSNQIGLILEPVSMGLGFTVLPAHAVAAFQKQDSIRAHHLASPVSETLYLCQRRNRSVASRVNTVIKEAKQCLSL